MLGEASCKSYIVSALQSFAALLSPSKYLEYDVYAPEVTVKLGAGTSMPAIEEKKTESAAHNALKMYADKTYVKGPGLVENRENPSGEASDYKKKKNVTNVMSDFSFFYSRVVE